ncbi:MAG: DUF4167 domain-containing protein [Pseudomonadota bacterium]
MRSSKSRSRSKSNRNRSMGNIVNRVFDSSGPEGKVRGTPQQIIDKYNQLARDAQLGNDRVAAENFQQHAEHYLRMLAEAQREQNERREQQEREQEARREQQERERAERRDQPNAQQGQQPQPAGTQQPDLDAGAVLDVAEGEPSGLVETPESKPARPRRSRKPKVQDTGEGGDSGSDSAEPQEAAE